MYVCLKKYSFYPHVTKYRLFFVGFCSFAFLHDVLLASINISSYWLTFCCYS